MCFTPKQEESILNPSDPQDLYILFALPVSCTATCMPPLPSGFTNAAQAQLFLRRAEHPCEIFGAVG